MTTMLTGEYGLSDELQQFLDDGFLEIVSEDPSQKTLTMHIPSLRYQDIEGRITSVDITWIHPEHNAEFCHYYNEQPGDLPNFYLDIDTTDFGVEHVDLESHDDLIAWLESHRR